MHRFGAFLAVFRPIGLRDKSSTADLTPLDLASMEDFRFQRGIAGEYEPPKPFAVDRVGNALHTDRFLAIIQQ